jgi:hypothetical protein
MNTSNIPQTSNGTQRLPAPEALSQTPGNPAPNGYSGTGQSLPVPLVYTVEETAAVLNCCTKSIRRLISRGYFCPCKVLRKKLIPRKQVEDFLKATCDKPKTGN